MGTLNLFKSGTKQRDLGQRGIQDIDTKTDKETMEMNRARSKLKQQKKNRNSAR